MHLNLFDATLILKGFPIYEAKRELLSIQKNYANNVEEFQERKKWEIFNHHVKNNKAYNAFIKNYRIEDWLDIPILTKNDIQLPLYDRLSIGYSRNKIHLHSTSGSSGTPFYFAKDKFCHAMSWALIFDRFGWHNVRIGHDLQARFYGVPLSKKKYYREKLKDYLAHRIRFSVFDLSDSVLKQYLEIFSEQQIDYINGYTSSLVLFAKYLIKENIILS